MPHENKQFPPRKAASLAVNASLATVSPEKQTSMRDTNLKNVRFQENSYNAKEEVASTECEAIVISSDEDEDETPVYSRRANTPGEVAPLGRMPGEWPETPSSSGPSKQSGTGKASQSTTSRKPPNKRNTLYRDNAEVFELSDSSPESSPTRPLRKSKGSPKKALARIATLESPVALYDQDEYIADEAILNLNETPARKLVQRAVGPGLLVTPTRPDPKSAATDPLPSHPRAPGVERSRSTPIVATSPSKKRTSKKAEAEAQHMQLVAYAQQWFNDVNRVVFNNRIPSQTELLWNVRLVSTAGRARYQRTKEGVETSKIDLSKKVLDSEDRIRRTLSHEMCHLACWCISNLPHEQHGKVFWQWAAKVMQKFPEVEITTTHNYEIKHPFEWKCTNCGKIYGRFSKSIKTEFKGCGVKECNGAELLPLFQTRKRTLAPGTPQKSRMAASKPRDSPQSLPRESSPTKFSRPLSRPPPAPNTLEGSRVEVICIHESDPHSSSDSAEADSEIEILGTKLASVSID